MWPRNLQKTQSTPPISPKTAFPDLRKHAFLGPVVFGFWREFWLTRSKTYCYMLPASATTIFTTFGQRMSKKSISHFGLKNAISHKTGLFRGPITHQKVTISRQLIRYWPLHCRIYETSYQGLSSLQIWAPEPTMWPRNLQKTQYTPHISPKTAFSDLKKHDFLVPAVSVSDVSFDSPGVQNVLIHAPTIWKYYFDYFWSTYVQKVYFRFRLEKRNMA